jgi:hypothetical protein
VITMSSEAGENSDTPSVQTANLRSFVRARFRSGNRMCPSLLGFGSARQNSRPSNIEAHILIRNSSAIFVSNDDLHFATLPCGIQVHPNQSTETGTIHVIHIG